MANTITTFQPDFDVQFITPNSGQRSYKNDVVRIEVHQTVDEMVNQWKVIMKPRDYDSQTAYEFIDVMTYCEISFKKHNTTMTPVIRGFVTKITKNSDISQGKAERNIIIEGENYGKIIRMSQIHYLYGYDKQSIVSAQGTSSPIFQAYHIDTFTGNQNISEIIGSIFTNLVLPNFENVKAFLADRTGSGTGSGDPSKLNWGQTDALNIKNFDYVPDTDGVTGLRNVIGKALTFVSRMAGANEGSVYDFIKTYCNFPWNEIFVEDLPTSTRLNFRPTPFRDIGGNFIGATNFTNETVNPNIATIDSTELISYNLSRSDEDVINYFFTDCVFQPRDGTPFETFARATIGSSSNLNLNPTFIAGEIDYKIQDGTETTTKLGTGDYGAFKLAFSRIELFGLRKKTFSCQFISVTSAVDAKGEPQVTETSNPVENSKLLNQVLVQAYDHNSALENGSFMISGREDIRAGMYVEVQTNRTEADTHMYYVSSLVHIFIPFANFTTQLNVTRGEGYLDHKVSGQY